VDSLSFGGTGKTPLVITIGQALEKRALPFAVISRGYRSGLEKSGALVECGQGPDEIGDEPWLLKKYFPKQDIIIGRDRLRSIATAAARKNRVIIMNDGLQNSQVKKDFSIMLIHPGHPYFYLRHFRRVARSASLVLTFRPQVDGTGPVAPGTYQFRGVGFFEGENNRVDIGNDRIVAFSALGDNERFQRDMGRFQLAAFRGFPDHHAFRTSDLRALEALRRDENAKWLVCTEKDFGKIRKVLEPGIPLIFFRNRIELPGHAMEQIIQHAAEKGFL
jgi:tetraacyldisaccharide 4'-kinase